jgi:RNA polymerase sigma-70 factor (ECF subfamily)
VDESELVEKCRRGDREAQRELYARTSDRIYGLLLRLTGNPDDAFELAQDTYVRVFTHIHQFDGASAVATWIYQIAVNEARQFLRRRRRYAEKLGELEQRRDRSAAGSNIDDRLDVEEALAKLPDDEKEMIVLRHYQGMSYAEMAQVLGKPQGTIASGLNRAREMLRGYLKSES